MKEVGSRRSRLLGVIAALALMLSILMLNILPAVAQDRCLFYDEYGSCILWQSEFDLGAFDIKAQAADSAT